MEFAGAIQAATGSWPSAVLPLSGGCVGEVWLVEMPKGDRLVAKVDERRTGQLETEGFMLEYLSKHAPDLPSPECVHADAGILLMQHLPGSTGCSKTAEHDLARLVAYMHDLTSSRFGFVRETVVGRVPQPNDWSSSWPTFFGERRLVHCARLCFDTGRLDKRTLRRIEEISGRLDGLLEAPEQPSLLHGDLWSGNVLTRGARVTGLIDPAVYYGHPEVEMAFLTLFRTVGDRFFSVYNAMRGIKRAEFEEFYESRRDLYNLFPLLVHLYMFGEQYLEDVHSIAGRFASS